MGNFDDLIPKNRMQKSGAFDDLIPVKNPSKPSRFGMAGPLGFGSNPKQGVKDIKNAYTKSVDYAPDVYQVGGNIVGTGVGSMTGNPVFGGHYGGSVGRGVGEVMKEVGYGRKPTMETFNKGLKEGATGELFGLGAGKFFKEAIPAAKNQAKNIILSYLKPKGELTEKGGQIAETILKEDLARGNMGKMLGNASGKAQSLTREVDAIIQKYSGRKGNAGGALKELDSLSQQYFTEGDPQAANHINTLKENLIKGRKLNEPIYSKVSTPDNLGMESSRIEQTGVKPRDISVDNLQNMKREQYRTLARKKSGGGFGSEVKSSEIEGRQKYASGLRQEIEDVIPEENIAGKNQRIADVIDAVKALQEREPVAGRKNILDIGDLILGGASFSNPQGLGILAGKRLFGSDAAKNFAARKLYNAGELTGGFGDIASLKTVRDFLKNKYGRAMFGSTVSSSSD